jgi:hypothetical protein
MVGSPNGETNAIALYSSYLETSVQRPAIVTNAYLFCVSSKSIVEGRYFAEAECEKRGIEI